MAKNNLLRNSGRKNIEAKNLRKHCVSVRLSIDELEMLDMAKGCRARGEAMRILCFSNLPDHVPAINSGLRYELGRGLGNLSTIATAMRAGEYVEIEEIRALIISLRERLIIGVKT